MKYILCCSGFFFCTPAADPRLRIINIVSLCAHMGKGYHNRHFFIFGKVQLVPPTLCTHFQAVSRSGVRSSGLVVSFALPAAGGKETAMKFTYRTATENITIDVADEWVAVLEDLDRLEENNNHTETRRHFHFEALEYEGMDYASDDEWLERLIESDTAKRIVEPALKQLTPAQRLLIDALFYKEMTAREYADSRGLNECTVSLTKKAAIKKLKKILKP